MNKAAYNLRRADVMTRRKVREALRVWWLFNVRLAAMASRLAAALPRDRSTQDAALYACSLVACLVINNLA